MRFSGFPSAARGPIERSEIRALAGTGLANARQGFSLRSKKQTLLVALLLITAPASADDATRARALLGEAEAALTRREGSTAQLKLEQAVTAGIAARDVRHLLAHAFMLQGKGDQARAYAAEDTVPPQFAAYAARMRAAVAPNRAVALAELTRATKLAPNDTRVWTDLARQRLFVGDLAEAFAAAEQAVATDPGNVEAMVLAGNLVRKRYGYRAALEWYQRAIDADPRFFAARAEQAATLGELGRDQDARAAIRAIYEIWPNAPEARFLHAVVSARAGDWINARGYLYKIGGRMGDMPGQRLLAGAIELAQGNAEQAVIELRPLVVAQPDNAVARRLLAAALVASDDPAGALVTLKVLTDRADADTYSLTLAGRAAEAMGDRRGAAGFLDRASRPLKGASVPFPGRTGGGDTTSGAPGVIVFAGDVLAGQGRWRAAADAYRKAANLDFSEATMLRLTDALRRSGQTDAALSVLATFRAQNRQNVAGALMGADVELANKRWDAAAETLEGLRRRIGGQDATLLSNLAWARLGQGRGAEALALGREAYRLAPNNPPVVASYGWFAHLAGDKATAVALLEKAVALAPDIAQYGARLAVARR